MVYTHAVIPRLGLGNALLPWARAEVFSRRFDASMLAPFWFKPMLGPLLRREADPRFYWRLFRATGYVGGLPRLKVLWRSPRMVEPTDWYLGTAFPRPEHGIVTFQGLKPPARDVDYFRPLWGEGSFLHQRLLGLARSRTLQALPARPEPFIGVHVRRGDLARSLSDPRNPAYIPPNWFVDSLRSLAAHPFLDGLAVKVMTDGDADFCRQFAGIPRVEFVNTGNALANILYMARSRIFLGTGYSTFSRWISFLGAMPSLYFPGYVPPPCGNSVYSGAYDPLEGLSDEVRRQIAFRSNQTDEVPYPTSAISL